MPCLAWRTQALRGGQWSPQEVTTRKRAELVRRVEALIQQGGADPETLQKLLQRSKTLQRLLRAQGLCHPAAVDPRKQARPNTGRVSKPELGNPNPRGRVRINQVRIS